MTKRYYIKTIEDIKYCEENNLVIRDSDCKNNSYAFEGNCWVCYLEGQPTLYNASIRLGSKLYYEEQKQQETSKEDIGKLCFGWNYDSEEKDLGILKDYNAADEYKYHIVGLGYYKHCRPLTKEEIKEFMEKAE